MRERKGWSEGLMGVAHGGDDAGQRREGMRKQRF